MAKMPARNIGHTLDGVALECYLDNFTQNVTPETPVVTAFCDDGPRRVLANYDWNHAISGPADLAAGAADATLYGLVGSPGAPSSYEPPGSPAQPVAPVYSGTVVLGSYQIQHRVGQAATYSGQLLGTSPLTRDVRSSLLEGLVSYWQSDEASGNLIDIHGTNHLTAVNGPTSAAGKAGTARQFVATSTQYFSIADNPDLSTGDVDFAIACWVYADSLVSFPMIVGKYATATNQRSFMLQLNSTMLMFAVSPNGINDALVSSAITPTLATWYFVIGWHDSVNNTINIQVNNGAVQSTPYGSGVFDSSAPFEVGGRLSAATATWDGRIDEVAFWKGFLPTADQRTALFNGGSGTTYPFVGIP